MKNHPSERILITVLLFMFSVTSLIGCEPDQPNASSIITATSSPSLPSINPTPSVTLPPGKELDFDVLMKSSSTTYRYGGEKPQIYIVTSVGSLLPETLDWIDEHDRTPVLNTNYQGNFVILVFNGYRGNIYSLMDIKKVWRDGNSVFILVHFNDAVDPKATFLAAFSSQYEAVKVRKTQLGSLGTYTFKLLDEGGSERASVITEIFR
jgi:hypothetical protein